MPKVCFAIPTIVKPYPEFVDCLEKSIPLVHEAGWEECSAWEIGHAYVSYARALLLRKFLSTDADFLVYLDHDLTWDPPELVKLLNAKGDIVAGTYRLKSPLEEYMGRLEAEAGKPPPQAREDGCLPAFLIPAGFLKISRCAVELIMEKYPHLNFSRDLEGQENHFDMFNHGVITLNGQNTWFGEDYAFSLRWKLMGNPIWLIPNLNIDHHAWTHDGVKVVYKGNFQKFLDSTSESERTPNSMGRLPLEVKEAA